MSSSRALREPVVVVGAGPAGSAAAITLRRHGVQVLVLDRAFFPRDKVCGDVILPDAQQALAELGLNVTDLEDRAYPCTGARYVATDGKEVSGGFHDMHGEARPWLTVKRAVFDHWLTNSARAAGAEIREGWSVRGVLRDSSGDITGVRATTPDGTIRTVAARAVVGADGAGSAIARQAGLLDRPDDHTCVAVRTYAKGLSLPAPYVEVFTTEHTLPGCAWIVPVAGDECNVGVGVLKRDRCNLVELFNAARERVPKFGARLSGAQLGPFRGWMLPGASQRRSLVGEGFVLAGDAGAMVDPFTGHGIHCALTAGRVAGEVMARAVDKCDVTAAGLQEYESRCRDMLGDEFDKGSALQRVHSRASLMKFVVHASGVHPGLRSLFLALLGHAAPRAQLLGTRHLARSLFSLEPVRRGA